MFSSLNNGKLGVPGRWQSLRRFLLLFCPLALLTIGASVYLYREQERHSLLLLQRNEEIKTATALRVVMYELEKVASDLRHLATEREVKLFLAEQTNVDVLHRELGYFLETKELYDHIAVYDRRGKMLFQTSDREGIYLVPAAAKRHGMYMAPISLSLKGGEPEWPLKPVVSLGMPVTDESENLLGYVSARYQAGPFLEGLQSWNQNGIGRFYVNDDNGYWICGPKAEDEWGFFGKEGEDKRFQTLFPGEWGKVRSRDEGSVFSPAGLFTFVTVRPNHHLPGLSGRLEGGEGAYPAYKIISHVPPHLIKGPPELFTQRLILFELGFLLILAGAAAYGTHASLRKEMATAKLAQAHDQLQRIFDTAADGLMVVDIDRRVLRISERLAAIAGVNKDEAVGRACSELLPGSACSTERCTVSRILRGEPRVEAEEEKIFANGRRVCYAVSATPLKGGEKINGVVMSFKEITSLKEAHQKIVRSRDFYLTLFDCFPTLIWKAGLDGKCNYFNRAWLDFTGRPLEQEIGDGWAAGVHPDDLQRCLDIYLTSFGRREPFQMEYRLRHHDGSHRWILDNGRPYNDLDGAFAGYIGSCYDIHERKEMEQQLKNESDFAASLIEGSGIAAFVLDPWHHVLIWNQACEDLTGIRKENAIGKSMPQLAQSLEGGQETLADLLLDRSWEKMAQLYRITHPVGQSQSVQAETWFCDGDGRLRYLLVNASPIFSTAMEVIAVIQTCQDITERKVLEDELWSAKEAAVVASRAKSDFLAKMSHELRTPMNGIIGMTELTLETDLTEEQREYLELARESADTLMSVVNDILDFSKIEAGKLELERTLFHLEESLAPALKTLALQARKKGLDFAWAMSPDIPSHLVGDPRKLIQVIVNLVNNAIKFTQTGEILVEGAYRQGADRGVVIIEFCVTDTGIGIPPDKKESIFDSFTQADSSTTRKYGGTGLGLSICKKLVEMMKGRIWLESSPGRGSSFHFTIQCDLPEGGKPPEAKAAEKSETGLEESKMNLAKTTRPLRVLIAEDNEVNQKLVSLFLEKRGHEPRVVENGLQVLQALKEETPDLVLMDVQMPEMDGLEATAAIHRGEAGETVRDIQIVAMTAHALRHDQERCLEAGMNDHIGKPLKMLDLISIIERFPRRGENSQPPPVWDREVVVAALGGDEEVLQEICEVFRANAPRQVEMLRNALQSGDFQLLQRHAHSLKGAAANIGALALQKAAHELERAAASDPGRMAEKLSAVEEAVPRVIEKLQEHFG